MPSVCNIAAEQAVLGCVLRRDTTFFDIQNDISGADFYDARHRTIWNIVSQIASAKKGRFDIATVSSFLPQDGDDAIPRDYLERLLDAVSDPGALRAYISTVVDLARTRRMIVALQAGVQKLMQRPPEEPLAEMVEEINGEVLDAARADASLSLTLGDCAMSSYLRLDNVRTGRRKSDVFRWGLNAMDKACGPAIPGNLHIIGGRSEMGKTALALGVAIKFADQAPGAIIELEMRSEAIADRAISYFSHIPAQRFTRNEILDTDELGSMADAIDQLQGLPIHIVARPGLTIEQIRARCIGLARRHGCRWFFVDHLQIIRSSSRYADQSETIDRACRELANMAKELDAVVVALSQVNSKNRDRDYDRPQSRDLMYFNSIEPHADLIIFPYRPEVSIAERRPPEPGVDDAVGVRLMEEWQKKLNRAKGRAEIVVGKNRHGQSGIWEECSWNGPIMRFEASASERSIEELQYANDRQLRYAGARQ